jgi:hypothetical protein
VLANLIVSSNLRKNRSTNLFDKLIRNIHHPGVHFPNTQRSKCRDQDPMCYFPWRLLLMRGEQPFGEWTVSAKADVKDRQSTPLVPTISSQLPDLLQRSNNLFLKPRLVAELMYKSLTTDEQPSVS